MITDKDFVMQWRSDLLSQAESLKQQRAAILSTVAILEKMYNLKSVNRGNGNIKRPYEIPIDTNEKENNV